MRDEGVIKFECRWKLDGELSGALVDELIAVRRKLFEMNLIGVYPDGIGFGNISAREPRSKAFIISASQTGHFPVVDGSHFSIVDDYNVDENWIECSGTMKASSESLTHAMIYEVFPDASAVIHVHESANWQRLQGLIPTSRADVPYGTPDMAGEVARLARESTLPSVKAFVMAGHEDGILSFGASLDAAMRALLKNLTLETSFQSN